MTVAESGFIYIFKCIAYYSGSCFYPALYLALLICFFIKGSEKEKEIFVWPGLMLALTVYNPVMPVLINSFFDINKEYYRFFWITPIVIALSYGAVKIIYEKAEKRGERLILILAAVLFLMGSGSYLYSKGYTPVSNNYKMPGEVIQISDIIHRTSEVKYPRALCDYNLNMELRQYDASILLTADRERYMAAVAGNVTDDMLNAEDNHVYRLLDMLLHENELPEDVLEFDLKSTNTEYIVLSKESGIIDYLKSFGFREVGDTKSRLILHYDIEDAEEFVLADYTDVWNAQSW